MSDLSVALTAGFIAIFATLTGSFSGGATSLIMFPLMLIFVSSNYLDALTVNKIATMFMTIAAGAIHFKKMKVNKLLFIVLIVFGLIGTAIGTYLVQYKFNGFLFEKMLAGCLLFTAVYLFIAKDKGVHKREHLKINFVSLLYAAIFSILINIVNGLFGGTGMFMTLFFVVIFKMTFIESMVYTMPTYAIINVFQTAYLAHATNILEKAPLLAITMAVCGTLGGVIGTRLQYLKGNLWVKRVAISVTFILGIKTLIG
ncbi:MAG: sulfite exporter TauE/SafE family protein [Candidatus Gracilibacteria bacterium]